MKVDLFDYYLPKELIAQTPAEPRDSSKLLVYNRLSGAIQHHIFHELDQLLTEQDVLVLNQTQVEPRRLFGHKHPSGGKVEVLLLDKISDDHCLSNRVQCSELNAQGCLWECKVHPGLHAGQRLIFTQQDASIALKTALEAVVIAATDEGNRLVQFNQKVEDVWQVYGILPIPPYITDYHGDAALYQTIYAHDPGSVAAPTAGRHFTQELLNRIKDKGVQIEHLTLHVSRDTAFPIVKQEAVEDVHLHSEWVDLPPDVANRLNVAKNTGKRIIAVGTTSVRTLEGIATQHALEAGHASSS